MVDHINGERTDDKMWNWLISISFSKQYNHSDHLDLEENVGHCSNNFITVVGAQHGF
jgi:hypothetical protein